MAETGQEKTEEPTPRKRQEAREEGNVAKSTDLIAAATLLAAVALLWIVGMRVLGGMKMSVEMMLSSAHAGNPTRADDLGGLASYAVYMVFSSLAPVVLAIGAVGLLATVGQVGFLVTGKPLTPDLGKLSPLKGVKNLLSIRAIMRLVMSLGKLALIAAVAGVIIYRDTGWIVAIGSLHAGQAFAASAQLVFSLALKLAALLLVLAIIDYVYQRWQREQDLKMTKQEVRDEMKKMEGDPMVKQRRARVARQLAMQRTAQSVPQADVIVTNPTHYSVALKYEGGSMRAPKVLAKGADFLAMRIRQIAAAHDIPIVERKPLARALYANVEVGQEIPPEHFAAVAEILAYVYRVTRKSA